jgi:magnesium transporter
MGGNVGIQSSAIIIQGLANNSLGIENPFKKLIKEFLIALLNGSILSTIILAFNLLTSDSYVITISVSIALFSVILFATLFGTFVPLILNRYKIDPALATGPFITTVDDISGVFIYLAICKLLLGVLG